jgi:hypothetical protein
MEGGVVSQDEITALAKRILNSELGGMEGPDIAQLAMTLINALVFKSPPEKRDFVINQLRHGFEAAIAEAKTRADFRESVMAEGAKATKQ